MKIKNLSKKQQEELEKFGANTWFVEYLYNQFSSSPDKVPEQWRKFFGDISSKEGGNRKNPSEGYALVSSNIPLPQPGENDDLQIIAGSSEKILGNMVSSLSIPVATSQRTIPVKLLEENKATFTLKGLFMPSEIEKDLIEKWKANWLTLANKEGEVIDQEEIIYRDLGTQEAELDFGLQASKVLAQNADSILGQQYPYKRSHIVGLIVQGHVSGVVQKPDLHKRMTSESNTLSEVIAWLREHRQEGQSDG